MKITFFISGSLSALGLWLAAAYLHNEDVASYHGMSTAPVKLVQSDKLESEEKVIETASLSR